MALPLLIGAGMGILGGAQYLMKKSDDRKVESLLDSGYAAMSNTAMGQQYGDQLGFLMDNAAKDRGFFDAERTDRVDSLFNDFMTASMTYDRQQQQQAFMAQQAWNQSNEGRLNSLQGQREANQVRFGAIQDQARNLNALYKGGDLSGVNLQGMINAVARMQFPDEALNQGDVDAIVNSTPILAQWSNRIANMKGKADPELAKSIYEFGQDYYGGARGGFEAGERNINDAVATHRSQGYLPSGRIDRRYGTFDPDFDFAPSPQTQPIAPTANPYQEPLMLRSSGNRSVIEPQLDYVQQFIDGGMSPEVARRLVPLGN